MILKFGTSKMFAFSKIKFLLIYIPIIFYLIFLTYSCAPLSETQTKEEKDSVEVTVPQISRPTQIRVLIENDFAKKEIQFSIPVLIKFNDSLIASADSKDKIKFDINGGNIELKIGKKKYENPSFDFESKNPSRYLEYNKQSYPGKLRLIYNSEKFWLVNILEEEEYVQNVVAAETGKQLLTVQNLESIKALAVCVRNYSYLKINEHKDAFDVHDDTRDQLYKGFIKSDNVLDSAIIKTKNQVLTFENQLANVFYFSSCGGFTESSENVFPKATAPYLAGVKDGEGPNCKISPSFNWEESFSQKQLINLLVQANYLTGKDWVLKDIYIASRFKSDRVNELIFSTENKQNESKRIVLSGNLIRSVIKTNQGKNLLKSTVFDVAVKRKKNNDIDQIKFVGKGNGHGVGLCQWGAIGLAQQGQKYDEILQFYFPGTKLETLND
ncbi:MAG: SpoIID/LytB domain-containing protein [Ignavibacteriales bacterium]|nr:SpoIID/LytB domain-containing protein [Ignavibacteriales bacterium]